MEKQRWEESEKRRREKIRREKELEERRCWCAKRYVEKSKDCVFQMFCGSGGSKSRLAKAARANLLGRWEMKNCTPFWCEAHVEVKKVNTSRSEHFWKLRCPKFSRRRDTKHISKSKLLKTHVWKLRCWKSARRCGAEHFWKLRCRKSAHRCGGKRMSKSKCTKHLSLGALLQVQTSKKCASLWRKARFEVKMYKAHHSQSTFWS